MHADTEMHGNAVFNEHLELAAEVLRLLSDPTRMRIVLTLQRHGELSVNALAGAVGRKAPAVSQHLAKMRMARMVTTRQQGTHVLYRLIDEHALTLVQEAIHQAEHAVASGSTPPRHHEPVRD